MRNERWVYRFLFAWDNTLFFDPLDVYYEPSADHFLAGFDEKVRARFVRSGIWWSHRHNPELPAQGWKIHVSSGHRQVREVAASVIGHLTEREIDFKIALDLNVFEMLNSKSVSRGSGGKLVTVYPRDDDEFRACLAGLAELLEGVEGAYVLSDMRYRDSKALYFRYGQFLDTHTVDVLGRRLPRILGPDGPVADDRRPGYAQPDWVPWPFDDWKPADEDEEDGDGLLGGRFRVTGALQFSNSGGVYTAEDTEDDDRKVVLKEARPYTNLNPRQDHDAVDILDREWMFLNRLADVGAYPAPVAKFRHWEHHYIAEEFIDRIDMRSVLLERNPLARPGFDVEQSREYLRIFLAVFRGLARAVRAAHDRGVILTDLTAANLLIDPDTHEVTIVDLEACRLADTATGTEADDRKTDADAAAAAAAREADLSKPVELFTPGFSLSRNIFKAHGPEGDRYALASTMAYFVFPIAAMSYLREDVLDLYRIFITEGLGWPEEVHRLITDLARDRIGLTDVLTALEDEADLLRRVEAPPAQPVTEERLGLVDAETGVAAFVEAVADTARDTLFPVDPFAHVTNPLSLGFGASGVLWALHSSGVPVRPEWHAWLAGKLEHIDVGQYPDGLMNGLSGIAWAADTLGLGARARELLTQANRRAIQKGDYTFYYGLSGVGMTNLRFFLRHRDPRDLTAARECARILCQTARRDGGRAHWLNEFATEGPLTGLGFGQAGVAMFLLRMHQVTGEEHYLRLGREALAWEMAHAKPLHDGGPVMFEHEGTMEPYVEVGSAGVAQVLLRYGDLDAARAVLRGLDVRYSVLPGYSFGMSGIADALLDAAEFTGDRSYRDTALRQLDIVRRVFLFEPAERFALSHEDGRTLLGLPGEGLLRCSTDYLTGSAGVLRVLHRVNTGSTADFLLDEVGR
ncbi:lanthionine synthetase LanC family protein [Streptomyces sp. VNUA116]|uniref:class III lanthionine synthetase LanKC N-terminal domain-containing protein n=1 Tax=Streptomyces sp. VNUA116 TaxID=3062449 RepID=UPI0026746109|nr:lanthionine synthetase LanC family protein [Streptomyces sp. VNUA116]WKU43027.1 lanthionine synthetase LanC family protein [Streptomyces sp. VNUA116]